jgi:hypothetical protein
MPGGSFSYLDLSEHLSLMIECFVINSSFDAAFGLRLLLWRSGRPIILCLAGLLSHFDAATQAGDDLAGTSNAITARTSLGPVFRNESHSYQISHNACSVVDHLPWVRTYFDFPHGQRDLRTF